MIPIILTAMTNLASDRSDTFYASDSVDGLVLRDTDIISFAPPLPN